MFLLKVLKSSKSIILRSQKVISVLMTFFDIFWLFCSQQLTLACTKQVCHWIVKSKEGIFFNADHPVKKVGCSVTVVVKYGSKGERRKVLKGKKQTKECVGIL